jgi:hypothetical protein
MCFSIAVEMQNRISHWYISFFFFREWFSSKGTFMFLCDFETWLYQSYKINTFFFFHWIGPGLGRNQSMLGRISIVIDKCKAQVTRETRGQFHHFPHAAFTSYVASKAFLCLHFRFVLYWRKTVSTKTVHRMLVKLSPDGLATVVDVENWDLSHGFESWHFHELVDGTLDSNKFENEI